MDIKKYISIEKIYNILKKYYRLIFCLIIVLIIVFNLFIFYIYVYRVVEGQPEAETRKISVDQATLEKILDDIKKRESNLSQALRTDYPDIFYSWREE